MKTITAIISALAIFMIIPGCGTSDRDKAATGPVDNSKVIATVNGNRITQNEFDAYLKQRRLGSPGDTANASQVLEELINFELLGQDAIKKKVDQEEDVVQQLNLQRTSILASAAIRAHTRDNPLTDEVLRKDYESRMEDLKLTEYKLRHTLNEKEEDAKAVIAALEKGETFPDVAKKLSAGPSSTEGGDLGWLGEQDMIPGFREAALSLEKGKYSTPVQTQYGWHVIYLEDVRETPPPAFEKVQQQVKTIMQRKQIEDYIIGLRGAAKIEISEENLPKPPAHSDKAADPNPGSPLKSEVNMDNRY